MGGIPLFSAFNYLFSKLSVDANKTFNITFNIIYFLPHMQYIQQNTKYSTLLQKHCEGGLGNKPKACQVLASIIFTNTWIA